jgi:PTH2 family peptidyl-tRNA hydrolase
MTVKQVIVIRKDLKIRRGKEIAQGSHASMKWLIERLKAHPELWSQELLTDEEKEWLFQDKFTKVCLQVASEAELQTIFINALDEGLTVGNIIDSGATEFHGVPTNTCLAIGPHVDDRIDQITEHLKLY